MQGSSDLPTDVTLKLSDGSIAANKMLLALVSPVFKAMFYGDFKEANSTVVDIPDKKLRIMQMLLDAVFKGSCEMDSLDDIVPLIEVADYYQIEKKPLQQMCDEAILTRFEMNSTIDTQLLSKCAKVMSEQSIKKVVEMVMNFTKSKFTQLSDLPEQVLHHLLQRNDIDCEEVEIFNYLYDHHIIGQRNQTKLSQITASHFALVRFSLIPPQYLLTEVIKCEVVDKEQVHKAIENIYTSCAPLGQNDGDVYRNQEFGQYPRMANYSLKLEWSAATSEQVSITYKTDEYDVEYSLKEKSLQDVLESSPLKNGIYSFAVMEFLEGGCRCKYNTEIIALKVIGYYATLCTIPLSQYSIITMNNQDGCLFLKIIDGMYRCHSVKSTTSLTGRTPIKLKIVNICDRSSYYNARNMYSFKIIPAHKLKLRYTARY